MNKYQGYKILLLELMISFETKDLYAYVNTTGEHMLNEQYTKREL